MLILTLPLRQHWNKDEYLFFTMLGKRSSLTERKRKRKTSAKRCLVTRKNKHFPQIFYSVDGVMVLDIELELSFPGQKKKEENKCIYFIWMWICIAYDRAMWFKAIGILKNTIMKINSNEEHSTKSRLGEIPDAHTPMYTNFWQPMVAKRRNAGKTGTAGIIVWINSFDVDMGSISRSTYMMSLKLSFSVNICIFRYCFFPLG